METIISKRSFRPEDLRVEEREPGISAFMRIRNGEDFLEVAIRSHIGFFDEIVAIYNQCTDETPSILSRLSEEYGTKLRVFHYIDRVFPPGSEGHAKTPPDSPNSLVNYYNIALAQTRFRYAVKLDDDHLAIPLNLKMVVDSIRKRLVDQGEMLCFSGLNLIRSPSGHLGVYAGDPVSGSGDIGFFPVNGETFFKYDRRFEKFNKGSLKRIFAGFLYWHLKYMKKGSGFNNYELEDNPRSRYHKRLRALRQNPEISGEIIQVANSVRPGLQDVLLSAVSSKMHLLKERNMAILDAFGDSTVEDALAATVDSRWLKTISSGTSGDHERLAEDQ